MAKTKEKNVEEELDLWWLKSDIMVSESEGIVQINCLSLGRGGSFRKDRFPEAYKKAIARHKETQKKIEPKKTK